MTTAHPTPQPAALSTSTDLCLRLARANAMLLRRFDSALGNHHGISFGDFQLEKIGLVTRRADQRDARVGYAVVTPSGQELLLTSSTP